MPLDHPCFNAKAHRTTGRIHLAVAPKCNIQCRYCDRKYDCANESRPGVTSAVLTPDQAMVHLEEMLTKERIREIYEVDAEVMKDSQGHLHILYFPAHWSGAYV